MIVTSEPLDVQGENSCSVLYWPGLAATHLCHYLVEDIVNSLISSLHWLLFATRMKSLVLAVFGWT